MLNQDPSVADRRLTGRKIEREHSQEDSVVSGDSLQDAESDWAPLSRPLPKTSQRLMSSLTRKYSDPDSVIDRVSTDECLIDFIVLAIGELLPKMGRSNWVRLFGHPP